MLIDFFTVYSHYQIKPEKSLVRYVSGNNGPTDPLYPAGEWKRYSHLKSPVIGARCEIALPDEWVSTSPVQSIVVSGATDAEKASFKEAA